MFSFLSIFVTNIRNILIPNKGCTQINILLLALCYLSALFLVHIIVDHKIVDQPNLIENSVAFGRVLQNLVAFGRIFRSLFGYTGDSINHLIDKTFDSHQEYTIATSSLAPARGTSRLCKLFVFKHLQSPIFLIPHI